MTDTPAPGNSFADPELRRKIFFTIGALAVLRVGAYIPVPGVDADGLSALLDARGGPLGVLNAFSGGALGRFTLFSLGVIPYVNASIVAGLLKLGRGKRERAEAARRLTLPLALLQSFVLAFALARTTASGGLPLVARADAFFYLSTAATLTAGALFVLWLAEEITESGIGGGALLIVFACLIANALSGAATFSRLVRLEELGSFSALFIVAALLAAVFAVIRIETAQRKLTVNHSQRVVGRRMYGGSSSFLPLKLDQSGAVAAISAAVLGASILVLRGGWLDDAIYAALIVYFCCFSGVRTIDPNELSEQLKKTGGSMPGIRPGDATARHILWAHERVALGGAGLVAAVAILPDLLRRIFRLPFFFDGVQAVIVVAVALDAMTRVESYTIMRTYAKLLK
jgi:preprotein translocase subunit SecY